jgi:hypothetical protein
MNKHIAASLEQHFDTVLTTPDGITCQDSESKMQLVVFTLLRPTFGFIQSRVQIRNARL